jgi:RNA polymerase sigma-70 factor (ECF subfamily)
MNRDVARALQDLPEGQRRAVELVNVQGLDLAEAARISGQSVGSIKVAVHRALKALRARFEERE